MGDDAFSTSAPAAGPLMPVNKLQFDLLYAAFRVLESRRGHPLIDDELSALFVEAAEEPLSNALLSAGLPEERSDDGDRTYLLVNAAGLMTRFGDDFLAAELAAGTRQIVLGATGLDTRAYRLDWPPGTTVFELDYPHTLEFSARVLSGHQSKAAHTHVPLESLSEPWPESLCAAGFDPDKPSAWLIQPGILTGLSATDQDVVFERIIELTAPGSALTCDGDIFLSSIDTWDSDIEPLAPDKVKETNIWMLTYPDQRMRPAEWLAGHGWSTHSDTLAGIVERYGRQIPEDVPDLLKQHISFQILTANLPA